MRFYCCRILQDIQFASLNLSGIIEGRVACRCAYYSTLHMQYITIIETQNHEYKTYTLLKTMSNVFGRMEVYVVNQNVLLQGVSKKGNPTWACHCALITECMNVIFART